MILMANKLVYTDNTESDGIISRSYAQEASLINLTLTEYRVQNYKVFRDSGWIELKPIVLLYGENSAGKTALHQPLTLLKSAHNNEQKDRNVTYLSELDITGATYDDLVNKQYSDDGIVFEFRFVDENQESYVYKVHANLDSNNYYIVYRDEEHDITDAYDYSNIFFALRNVNRNTFHREIDIVVRSIMVSMRNFAKNCTYISPFRDKIQRDYNVEGDDLISTNNSSIIAYKYLYQLLKTNDTEAYDSISSWINQFGYDIECEQTDINKCRFVLIDKKTNVRSNLIDNGFGVGQSLPVIINMAVADDEMIILDSPDAFLQTDMQSVMADFIIDSANSGNTLFVETASEYILYRIRRRITEKKIDTKDVKMYFINNSDNSDVKCVNIKISEDGEVEKDNKAFNEFFSSDYEDLMALSLYEE